MLPKTVKHLLITAAIIPVIAIAALAGVITFTAPKPPPLIAAVENANDPFGAFAKEVTPYSFYTARDGAKIGYRLYSGQPGGGVAILVHGSSGSALATHGLAKAMAARGITAYAVDLRGHGATPGPEGRLGDVGYIGQYEDDLADLAQMIKRDHPSEKRLLAGHSMGGAIILRVASSARGDDYDRYLALAPFIAPNTPMDRPDQGGWTTVSIPRIVALSILNGFGVHAFDHLPVLAMAVPDNQTTRPRFYSHALLASANLPRDGWKQSLAAIKQPTQVMIGENDELFTASAYPSQIASANPAITVTLLPGIGHMHLMFDETALTAEADKALEMLK